VCVCVCRVCVCVCVCVCVRSVTAAGEVYTWGDPSSGMLGHGPDITQPGTHAPPYPEYLSPKRVEALAGERICSVSCGARSTAVVTSSGQLLMWGRVLPTPPALLVIPISEIRWRGCAVHRAAAARGW